MWPSIDSKNTAVFFFAGFHLVFQKKKMNQKTPLASSVQNINKRNRLMAIPSGQDGPILLARDFHPLG